MELATRSRYGTGLLLDAENMGLPQVIRVRSIAALPLPQPEIIEDADGVGKVAIPFSAI